MVLSCVCDQREAGVDVRAVLLVNPTAGKGSGLRWREAITTALAESGVEVEDRTADTPEGSTRAARDAVAEGVDALVVAGGDGMVHIGVNACGGTDVPLAIIPTGTGNDNASAHGLPHHPVTAARAAGRALVHGDCRSVDLARVCCADFSEHWYLSVLSLGFDAVVNERANRLRWPKGRARYNLAVARELPVFKPPLYKVWIDDEQLDLRAMLVSVANGRQYGGGMLIAPDARTDDGLLDVVILRPAPLPEFIQVFPRVFKGSHVTYPRFSIRTAKSVRVEVDRSINAYADGERLGPAPVTVGVVPGALRLLG